VGALVALVQQDRLDEAERGARSLLSQYPNAGVLWKVLGVTLLRQGRDALPALRRTTELLPNDAEAHGNLAAALRERGLWAEAFQSLRRSLELQPGNLEALIDAADALKALGRPDESIGFYRRALALDPLLTLAHNNLGTAYLELGRHEEAMSCYAVAVRLKPDDAAIHCNLGIVQRHLGLLEEALKSFERCLHLNPALGLAHNNCGLVLAALGRREESLARFRQALLLDRTDVDALTNMGNALRELGLRREAIAHYVRAIEMDPRRPEGHCNLGNALFEARRADEAAASFRRALALEPSNALALTSLAAVQRQQGAAAEALATCMSALAKEPGLVNAIALLGELSADRGEFRAAADFFQQALALDPNFAPAFVGIAVHRKLTREDADWRRGVEALLAKKPPLVHEISLRYALGKYFDDVGDYSEAFDSYRCANELTKRHATRYDASSTVQQVDAIIRRFERTAPRTSARSAVNGALPVFIIGMPRSGTSLAEQILASHPEVFGAGELIFWQTAAAAVDARGPDLLAALGAEYLERLTEVCGGASRVVDKMPGNFMHAGLIQAALPGARIIHMKRHPVDTCLSIYFQNFFNMGPYANDLETLAHYYEQYLRITDHWRAVLPSEAFMEVPYEGLIEDQEGWTRRMLEFIGLPWDPQCLEFERTNRSVITASKWQVRQKIHAGSVGRWKHYQAFIGPLERLLPHAG